MASAPPSDNLFVGNLPSTTTKEDFERAMSFYGSVTSCRVNFPKVPNGHASGLVRFGSVEEATWVVENLNGNVAEGLPEPLVVRFANAPGSAGAWSGGGAAAVKGGKGGGSWAAPLAAPAQSAEAAPSDNVFVGDLPADITQELFEQVFSYYGTVTSCRVLAPKSPGGKASGLCRFGSVEEAKWVVENVNGNYAEGLQEPVKCRFANAPGGGAAGGKGGRGWAAPSQPHPYGGKGAEKGGGKAGAPGSFYNFYGAVKKAGMLGGGKVSDECQLFVRNLPKDTTDIDLYKLFAPFGAIAPSGVKAMTNEDGSCKGIGFVDFVDANAASTAVTTLNGFAMADGTSIGVSLKKPSNKAQKGGKGAGKSEGSA